MRPWPPGGGFHVPNSRLTRVQFHRWQLGMAVGSRRESESGGQAVQCSLLVLCRVSARFSEAHTE